jgi:uncharacterized protein (DUF433 family)
LTPRQNYRYNASALSVLFAVVSNAVRLKEPSVPKLRFNAESLSHFSDPREMPAYSIPVAAHYLQLPVSTLRAWIYGQPYTLKGGTRRRSKPLIHLPEKDAPSLSFANLAEAHVLSALRRQHDISMPHIRSALDFLTKQLGWKRPLIEQKFRTDGVGLFVERLGKLIDVSADGQIVIRRFVEAYLERLEWENLEVARLFPFTRARDIHSPKSVVIDPRYSFGRPVLTRSHVATEVIFDRYQAGESMDELAEDYGCEKLDIEEAVRCESRHQAA